MHWLHAKQQRVGIDTRLIRWVTHYRSTVHLCIQLKHGTALFVGNVHHLEQQTTRIFDELHLILISIIYISIIYKGSFFCFPLCRGDLDIILFQAVHNWFHCPFKVRHRCYCGLIASPFLLSLCLYMSLNFSYFFIRCIIYLYFKCCPISWLLPLENPLTHPFSCSSIQPLPLPFPGIPLYWSI